MNFNMSYNTWDLMSDFEYEFYYLNFNMSELSFYGDWSSKVAILVVWWSYCRLHKCVGKSFFSFANSQDHKNCQKCYYRGGCTLIAIIYLNSNNTLNFLLQAMPFKLVILSEGLSKKNLLVTNLSDARDFVSKIRKKQLNLIFLLSLR